MDWLTFIASMTGHLVWPAAVLLIVVLLRRPILGLILVFMALIKDGRILRQAGLSGSCSAVAAPSGQGGYWAKCTHGSLEGWPDLAPQSCTSSPVRGQSERSAAIR